MSETNPSSGKPLKQQPETPEQTKQRLEDESKQSDRNKPDSARSNPAPSPRRSV